MRLYAENELHVCPGIHVRVGLRSADIIGDSNVALQAAVDYVAALGGGTVEIGAGEYLMRDSLHMRSGVTVRGTGPETVLKKDRSVHSALLLDGDSLEEALTLQNPDGFDIGRGVYICSGRARHFQSTCATILNRKGNYLTLSRPLNANSLVADGACAATVYPVISACGISDFRIENLVVEGNKSQNEGINGCRGSGIFLVEGHGAVIQGCTVRNFNGDGIGWQKSNDCQVLQCVAQDNTGLGLHPGSGSQRPLVRNCKSLNNGSDGFYFCWRVRNGVVEDNEIRGNGGHGISIGHKDSDNTLRRNVVAENAQGGVYSTRTR